MAFEDLISKKVGPLPVGAWAAIVGGLGFVFVRMKGKSSAATSDNPNAALGQGNQFSSSTTNTATDPNTGVSTSTSYSAQGNGFLPGYLSYAAGPMPYQQGDVYVNEGSTTQTVNTGGQTTTDSPQPPGQLQNVGSHTFPGSTNITWTLGDGVTTDVKITGTSEDFQPNFTVNESVDVRGQKSGDNGGHMFYIDQVSRGHSFKYTITPYNNGVAGPPATLEVKNAA